MLEIDNILVSLDYKPETLWARDNFLPLIKRLIQDKGYKSILEVGGGRNPSFKKDEIDQLGIRYTSNDISERELSLAPDWVGKAHFDISTGDHQSVAKYAGAYDLIFSRMVMEHVPSYRRSYKNMSILLKPGGMAISYHPTLFAMPFIVNKLLPETLSSYILRSVFPNRTDAGIPKFPAYYSGCFNSKAVRRAICREGFSEVVQTPIYSHSYYGRFPVIRDIHKHMARMYARLDLTPLTAFCFTIAMK